MLANKRTSEDERAKEKRVDELYEKMVEDGLSSWNSIKDDRKAEDKKVLLSDMESASDVEEVVPSSRKSGSVFM